MQAPLRIITLAATIVAGCSDYDDTTDLDDLPTDPRAADNPDDSATPSSVMPAEFAEELDHVVLDVQPSVRTVEALNANGEVIGRLALLDRGDNQRVVAEYADGVLVVDVDITNEEVLSRYQTLSSDELIHRARLIEDMLGVADDHVDPGDPVAWEGWTACGIGVAGTVLSCIPSSFLTVFKCPLAAAGATCACIKAANKGKAKKPCGKEKW